MKYLSHKYKRVLATCVSYLLLSSPVFASQSSDSHSHVVDEHKHSEQTAKQPIQSEENNTDHDKHGHDDHGHADDEHKDYTVINAKQTRLAGIKTQRVQTRQLKLFDTLFGLIAADPNRVFHSFASYPSRVEQVHVNVGDNVVKNQLLLTLRNLKTLQYYKVRSTASGIVTQRLANVGDRVNEQALLEIIDLSKVWVELSAFPSTIEKLHKNQPVTIYDMHRHQRVQSQISYISPIMTGGHIARARTVIDNPEGHWRPGMHIKADVEVMRQQVPLAVAIEAIQTFEGKSVVFVKKGQRFEVKQVTLGMRDDNFVEVVAGLKPGTEYVSKNSFLIKADLLKAGASHQH